MCILCIWPLYLLLSAVHYRWWGDPVDEGEIFKREYQKYLRDETGKDGQEAAADFDEFFFMRVMYLNAFPLRRKEIQDVLNNDMMNRLSSPISSQEDYAFVLDLLRPLVNCPSMLKYGNALTGRWTCGLDTFIAGKPSCYVYSFNWNVTEFDFEDEVLQRTNCIVHVFDPFLPQEHKERLFHLNPRLVFHDYTLGPLNDVRYLFDELEPELRSVEERNLYRITSNLEHRWVDIVKMDYNGEEASKLIEVLAYWREIQKASSKQLPFPVGQLLFSFRSDGGAMQIVRSTIALMNLGFAVYHTEPDLRTEHPWENIAFSFINMRDRRTFGDTAESL